MNVLKQWWGQSTDTRRGRGTIVLAFVLLITVLSALNWVVFGFTSGPDYWILGVITSILTALLFVALVGFTIFLLIALVRWVRQGK